MDPTLMVSVLIAAGVFSFFVGIRYFVESEVPIEERLELETPWPSTSAEMLAQDTTLSRPGSRLQSSLFERLVQRFLSPDRSSSLALALTRANLRLTVSEYVLIVIAVIAGAFVLGLLVTHNILFAAIAGVFGFLAPGWYLKWRERKRLQAFENQLSDVLTLLVGSLRAGYSLLHAMDVVAREVPPPASEEFQRVVREVGLGLNQAEALQNLVRRVPSQDLDLVVTAIIIQHEVGGNLATILETISETIRERVRIQGEIRVLTTQQTLTGYMLTLMPFLLGIVLYVLNPKYMSRLFTPGPMLIMPTAAVISMFIGFLIIRKIVKIEV